MPNSRIHGHSFHVRVTVEGEPDRRDAASSSISTISPRRSARCALALDHQFLNEVDGIGAPTLENITVWIWNRLEGKNSRPFGGSHFPPLMP